MVLAVGNGQFPNLYPDDILNDPKVVIPDKFLIKSRGHPIKDLVDVIYTDMGSRANDPEYFRQRAILTPTNAVVSDINSYILDMFPGVVHSYFSQDSSSDDFEENDFQSAFPIEYLNSINTPCLPRHDLRVKVDSIVMLMRNLNQIMGLCNGTRMIVKKCMPNSILCEVLTGFEVGTSHIIPRIEMEPTDTKWPFEWERVQFPLQLCYAMTINKSQGQSLKYVGLYLPMSVFSHGEIYVAVSRVTASSGLRILIDSDRGGTNNVTANVVFEEVFYNLPKSRNGE